jgi:uncharacterized protein (TIGR00369 family)
MHGGAIMAFADTLGAIGAFLNLPEGALTTTIESKTNFIGAAKEGTLVLAEAAPLLAGAVRCGPRGSPAKTASSSPSSPRRRWC